MKSASPRQNLPPTVRFVCKLIGIENLSTNSVGHSSLISNIYRGLILVIFYVSILRGLSIIIYQLTRSISMMGFISRACDITAKFSVILSIHLVLWNRKEILKYLCKCTSIIQNDVPHKCSRINRETAVNVFLCVLFGSGYLGFTVYTHCEDGLLGKYSDVIFYGVNVSGSDPPMDKTTVKLILGSLVTLESISLFYVGFSAVLSASSSIMLGILIDGISAKLSADDSTTSNGVNKYRGALEFYSQVLDLNTQSGAIFSNIHSVWLLNFLFYMFKAIPYVLERSDIAGYFLMMNVAQMSYNLFVFFVFCSKAADVHHKSEKLKLSQTAIFTEQYASSCLSAQESIFLSERFSYPICMSGSGFFTYTRSFMFSIVTGLFSYAAIIFQFVLDDVN